MKLNFCISKWAPFLLFPIAAFGAGSAPDQNLSTVSEDGMRMEFLNSSQMPNHIVFQSVLYHFRGRIERDLDAGTRLIQKRFGGTTTIEAVAITARIEQALSSIEQNHDSVRRGLLCENGGLRSRDFYYQQLDAIEDARLSNLESTYQDFMATLSQSQAEAFQNYLNSQKTRTQFRLSSYKHSYEKANKDVLPVVAEVCKM